MINLLEIDSVQLSYHNRKILQSIYLKSETGKVIGILGRNGCGKSSLLKILYGEISRCEKTIRLNGQALLSGARDPLMMRMLPHFSFIPSSLSIEQVFNDFEVDFPRFLSRFESFSKLRNVRIGQLSGGLVRAIEVYVILMSECCFVLLDEPFTHISPAHVEIFSDLIREEKKTKGIVITDHYYREVLTLSDELYLLSNGSTYLVKNEEELIWRGYLPARN